MLLGLDDLLRYFPSRRRRLNLCVGPPVTTAFVKRDGVEWIGSPMSGIPCALLGIATGCHAMSGVGASVPFHFPLLLFLAS